MMRKLHGRVLLADEMGLGKTVQTLMHVWEEIPDDRCVVVLCPASLKEHWKREAAHHLGMRCDILEHRKPPVHFNAGLSNRVYIINPDILGNANSSTKTWAKLLRQMKPACVMVDEAHMYGSVTSKRTKNLFALCRGVKKVIALTGTPSDDMPIKMWPVLHLLKPKLFPSYNTFLHRYHKIDLTPWGPKPVAGRRLKELHRVLRENVMIRRKFEDVFKDMPALTRAVVPIKLTTKARKEYDLAEKDFISWLRKTFPAGQKATRAEKAQRLVKFGYMLRLAAELKRPLVKEWIDNFMEGTEHKMVVFGVHKKMVRGLHDQYKGSFRIDGGVHPSKRQDIVDRFCSGKGRLLFGNVKAAGTGWSAKGVPYVGFAEFGLSPADLAQAEKRVQGIGRGVKDMGSVAYYLVAQGTIEERLLKILQAKKKTTDAMLDGKRTRGLEVADLLQAALLKTGGLS